MTDAADIVNALGGTLANDRGGAPMVAALLTHLVSIHTLAFEADDNTNRRVIFKNTLDCDLRLVSAEYVADVAVTASDTNYTIMRVYHTDTPASGTDKVGAVAQTTVAAGTGNITADIPVALTVASDDDALLAPGEYAVWFTDGATGGTGVDLPAGMLLLAYEPA